MYTHVSKHPELGVQLDSPTKDEELTVCKCSQLRPYLELGRSADIVGQCRGPICSTELLQAERQGWPLQAAAVVFGGGG